MSSSCRKALHAGSWYTNDATKLSGQLTKWLQKASETRPDVSKEDIRGIIGPHAGYSYSGPSAAFAYQSLLARKSKIKRIFLLGPSHHEPFDGCMLPADTLSKYATPLGDIKLDTEIIGALAKDKKNWGRINKQADEAEHSLEMHLPYIYHAMQGQEFTLVPIMVGSLHSNYEDTYGKVLAPYLDDDSNFFVISSDFCHWGKRFSYTPHDKGKETEIYKYIEILDRKGMDTIETGSTASFRAYLKETHNTICGRNPILVLLSATTNSNTNFRTTFVHYAQSSQCMSKEDSSVSYAAALVATE